MNQILCNLKGSRKMEISEANLETINRYSLFSELLDSSGIVDESVLDKLKLNVRSLLESASQDTELLSLCQDVLFHPNMKAFGLHQLILLYLEWEEKRISNTTDVENE